MCQNFKISALLLKTSNHLTNQQDDSLPLKTRQEHPAQQLWQIFYYIYLLKDINKLKGLLLNAGNSFIADAIRRFFIFFVSPFSISKLCDTYIPSARGKGSFHRRLGGNLSSHALHQALQLSACTDKHGKKVKISMQSITLLRKVWKLQARVPGFGSMLESAILMA